jgi:hypothetical protein
MGYFEQNPLTLILVIIATVEGWSALKGFLKRTLPSTNLRGAKAEDV